MADVYTRIAKPDGQGSALLSEDGTSILMEDGFKILLDILDKGYFMIGKPLSGIYTKPRKPVEPLKLQTGGILLLQNGGRILLNQSSVSNYTKISKPS